MASTDGIPIQPQRRVSRFRNGRTLDRQSFLVSGISAGSAKEALDALPPMGAPHPEGMDGFVSQHNILAWLDGGKCIAEVVYDTQIGSWGGNSYSASSGKAWGSHIVTDIPCVVILEPNRYALGPTQKLSRYVQFRRETRRANGRFLIDNIIEAIGYNLGRRWYTRQDTNGNPTSVPYVFVAGNVDQRNPEQCIITYDFIVQSPVPAIAKNRIGAHFDVPALGFNQRWEADVLTVGGTERVKAVNDFIDLPVVLPYLNT